MCPLLSVPRAFAYVPQRRCLASAPAMATAIAMAPATAPNMTMTVTPAMGLSPATALSLRVHVLTVAWRRFQLCSLLLLLLLRFGCYLFAHIFFKFCHKNWFMWLPQNVCFLSHSTQTLAPIGCLSLPPASSELGSLMLVSSALFPVHPAMFVHRMMLICQLEKRISCKIPAFPGTLKTWIHFY